MPSRESAIFERIQPRRFSIVNELPTIHSSAAYELGRRWENKKITGRVAIRLLLETN